MNVRVFSILKKITPLLLLAMVGCGGGGASSTPTDTSIDFATFPQNYFSSYNKTMTLTGSDTTGDRYTLVVSEQTLPQTTFLSTSAIPIQQQLQITNNSTGGVTNDIGNIYYTISASDRHYIGDDGDSVTVSSTTTAIPQTARIGDFGVVGEYIDNAGDKDTVSWRLDDGFNGNAKFVILINSEDQYGSFTGSETQTYLIDQTGNRLSLDVIIYYADSGIAVTLKGS